MSIEKSPSVFTQIIDRKIPANIVYEDDLVIAFDDINPVAPVHILVCPKEEITNLQTFNSNTEILSKLLNAIQIIAKDKSLDKAGYRVITNIGEHGQQTVPHLHFHIIGGRQLEWNN